MPPRQTQLTVAALLLAGCSLASPSGNPTSAPAATPQRTAAPAAPSCGPFSPECVGTPAPPTPPPTPRPTRTFESADFLITRVADDVYLMDPNGMALYTRNADTHGDSGCYEDCAVTWPPVTLLPGETARVKPARYGQVGEILRQDGSRQVTFDGKALYYYIGDTEALVAMAMCEEGWSMITPLLVEPLCP